MEKANQGNNPIRTNEKPKEFSVSIEIDGAPFIFKGRIDMASKDVDLSLYVPSWQQELKKIDRERFPLLPDDLLEKGKVGFVSASATYIDGADIYVEDVRSYTKYFPENSKYHDEKVHIGRFLINNLYALADTNRWRTTAFAATSGRLSDADMHAWMKRKGYEPATTSEALIRQPKEPDMGQPIIKLLG